MRAKLSEHLQGDAVQRRNRTDDKLIMTTTPSPISAPRNSERTGHTAILTFTGTVEDLEEDEVAFWSTATPENLL